MELEYICNECGREISSNEYEEQSDIFCSECGGRIEEITEDLLSQSAVSQLPETKETPSLATTIKSYLISCESCSHQFSERAKACPKCGSVQTQTCQICHSLIPAASSQCPECGDPSPFFIQDINQKNSETNSLHNKIIKETEGKTVIKRILITAPFVLFIMLIVGAVKELMQPGLLRRVVIVICFLSIFKFWGWVKD